MRQGVLLLLSLAVACTLAAVLSAKIKDEAQAWDWIEEYDVKAQEFYYASSLAAWNYNTNLTDHNQNLMIQASLAAAAFDKEASLNASRFDDNAFTNTTLKRLFSKIKDIGTAAMRDPDKLERLSKVNADMENIYSTGKVMIDGKEHSLDPELTKLLASSRNYTKLLIAWVGWRNATGKKMKNLYEEFVTLSNEAISDNGYPDTGDYWRSWYESQTFIQDLEELYKQLSPLYQNLHIYVRRKLKEVYGADKFPSSGHIPAHLLGNMWAQQWNNLLDIMQPYDKESVDVTDAMVEQGYDALRMFNVSEEFFTSLGLIPMPQKFWDHSMLEKPTDGREVVCHASAWDFYNQQDFRIKQCTVVTMDQLITVHHEMGHVEYYLQYKHLPTPFRRGANPGFHEAVGDVLALSVSTPKHLKEIGLLDNVTEDEESDINFLLSMALEKIAFLPFGYLMDQWRWSVFSGATPSASYNQKWWELRCKYQGVSPPIQRTEDDFDPGAKFHIPGNTPYIRYFVSFVIQFQFHKALCEEAGQGSVPLHECDIYRSKEAGNKLAQVLSLGSSKPWPDAMEMMTGSRKMNAQPLMDYFQPLTDWLKAENEKAGDKKGWDEKCPDLTRASSTSVSVSTAILLGCLLVIRMTDSEVRMECPWVILFLGLCTLISADSSLIEDEAQAERYAEEYNVLAEVATNENVLASWAYNTDLTPENEQAQVAASLKFSQFQKAASVNASKFDSANFQNQTLKRLFNKIRDVGTSALQDEQKQEQLAQSLARMEGIYSQATVNISGDVMHLEPGLTRLMATSREYDELLNAWKGWRDASGKKMRKTYEEFVSLSNEAIKANGFVDTGAWWKSWYESDEFEKDVEGLWQKVLPFYTSLHQYVRRELKKTYSPENFPTTGHIPAHLLGNMWAQDWTNILSMVEPYDLQSVDVTDEMKKKNYTPLKMFQTAEGFFTSLGLMPMTAEFWNNSMIERPDDGRQVVCHASAWDFFNGSDFRIKMCTDVTMQDLVTVHHEMGHIQYYMQYSDQPMPFREGANPGFHEAIGDVLALSVSTPTHLQQIGLLQNATEDEEYYTNYLMSMALDKIAFLPFGYLIDQWRWSVFKGETTASNYNDKWWQLRCKYQGISPPVQRTENDFDPGAKYHIPANTPYIRYFVSTIIQFQFHKALCAKANQTGPLYKCDIYMSQQAGDLLSDVLRMGSSEPWQDAMQVFTGQTKMDAQPMLDYFEPLIMWLKERNAEAGDQGGWDDSCPGYGRAGFLSASTTLIYSLPFITIWYMCRV
ncbi:angiotensin-converting enzyme-like [Liolophura sinensis]|uniref:angiotensin-converting enzyme-like n=1 Tax=Liolophura sinensis TaxID=3198878 RepID=UPI003159847E